MYLVTSDLHLSDRPRDAYRFGIFPWLAKQAAKYDISATFLLGDTTDQKDRHPALLVNLIVTGLLQLPPPVYILMGNHDFIDRDNPFFGFLKYLEGVKFITQPQVWGDVLMIPHQPDQAAFDAACRKIKPHYGVLLHQTIQGAIAETGSRLNGLGAAVIAAKRPKWCYSGDIHKPQQCGPVTYVGAPYHVRFGDTYTPRVLLLGDKPKDLHYPAPQKHHLTINDADELPVCPVRPGDHVKITLELLRTETVEWATQRQRVLDACRDMKLEVYGVELRVKDSKRVRVEIPAQTPDDVFQAFCAVENVDPAVKRAGAILMEAKHERRSKGSHSKGG